MAHGAYLHPLRTIEIAWERDSDGIAVVTGYRDQPPGDVADPGAFLIRHSDQVASHRFPVTAASDDRLLAECQAFLPEHDPNRDRLTPLRTTGRSFGRPWTTALSYTAVSDQLVCSDLEADLAGMALNGPTLFLGRRGASWWIGAQDTTLLALDRLPHPDQTPLVMFLQEALDDLLAVEGLTTRTLTVFGDQLTPDLLKQITAIGRGRLDGVERFNPFRHVRSSVNDAAAASLLKRAHLLGCLVGAMALADQPRTADAA